MVEVEQLRDIMKLMGWNVMELPVRNGQEVSAWKITAFRKDRSFVTQGKTQLAAMQTMARMVGAIRCTNSAKT